MLGKINITIINIENAGEARGERRDALQKETVKG
jgi:hypothetical protein